VRWTVLLVIAASLGVLTPAARAELLPCPKPANPPPPLALLARSRTHSVRVTIPSQFDFRLASLTLAGRAAGLRVTVVAPTGFTWVAAAARCDAPRHIFVLVVNRLPRGSVAPGATPASLTLLIRTRTSEAAPTVAQHVDVLADGAPGQDCSAIRHIAPDPPFTNYSGPVPLWGSALRPLITPAEDGTGELGGPIETVARAVSHACGVVWESTFERWVRQEPSDVAHP
jgi:hypothetical protein